MAHMSATLLAGGAAKTIKEAVHTAAQILESVDARIHRETVKPAPSDGEEANPFDAAEEE